MTSLNGLPLPGLQRDLLAALASGRLDALHALTAELACTPRHARRAVELLADAYCRTPRMSGSAEAHVNVSRAHEALLELARKKACCTDRGFQLLLLELADAVARARAKRNLEPSDADTVTERLLMSFAAAGHDRRTRSWEVQLPRDTPLDVLHKLRLFAHLLDVASAASTHGLLCVATHVVRTASRSVPASFSFAFGPDQEARRQRKRNHVAWVLVHLLSVAARTRVEAAFVAASEGLFATTFKRADPCPGLNVILHTVTWLVAGARPAGPIPSARRPSGSCKAFKNVLASTVSPDARLDYLYEDVGPR
jgi:hypothetical protein